MGAGRFRSQIIIERQKKTSDGGGGFTIEWMQVDTVPAEVVPIRSRTRGIEGESGGQITSMPKVEVNLRPHENYPDLLANAAGYRLKDAETGEVYGVNTAQDFTGKGALITLTATKGEPT